MLEIKYLSFAEVTIHLDSRLTTYGSAGSYASISWIREYSEPDSITPVGEALLKELQILNDADVMYGNYALKIRVPEIFDPIDVVFEIMGMVGRAVDDDIEFGTTLSKDAFTKPEFILNPTREQFDENIERSLAELRQHSTQDIAEAKYLIERLISLIEQAERAVRPI